MVSGVSVFDPVSSAGHILLRVPVLALLAACAWYALSGSDDKCEEARVQVALNGGTSQTCVLQE